MKKALSIFALFVVALLPLGANAQQSVPYVETFDQSNSLPSGWSHIGWGDVTIADASSYSYATYQGSGKALRFYYGTTYSLGNEYNVLVMPEMDQEISGLMLSFYTISEGYSGAPYSQSGSFDVGYVTSPTDPSSFVAVDTYTASQFNGLYAPLDFEVFFTGAPEGSRIAFQHRPTEYNYFWFLDQVSVMVATDCRRPSMLSVYDIDTASASVRFMGCDAATAYSLVISTTELEDPASADSIINLGTDTSYTLTNLSANTIYHIYVRTICGDEQTLWTTTTFRTECGYITTLPWTDGFEGYTYNEMPPCYTQLTPGSSSANYAATYNYTAHSGGQCLRFNYVNGRNVVMLPPFAQAISGMEMSFWHRPESISNSYCGTLQVGYLTDASDTSTFVVTGSWAYNDFSTAEYRMDEVTFAGAPEGSRIAFRHVGTGSANWYWHIDDIDIHVVPTCVRPIITFGDITDEEATINITDANDAGSYKILVLGQTDTIEVSGNTITIDELTPSTQYTVTAWTACDDGNLSQPQTTTFHTECSGMILPYTVNFSSMIDPCWTNNPANGMTISTGEQALYTNGSSNRLISPAIPAPLSDKMVRITWRGYSESYNTQVGIGDQDGNNVQWLETSPAVNDYVETMIFLGQYTGNENHIVIGGGAGYTYIRSITIETTGDCAPVSGLHAENVSTDEATIVWNSAENANAYIVEYQQNGTSAWTAVNDVNDTSATLSNLESTTTYNVRVRTDCGDDTSYTISTSFTTLCALEEFPWLCPQDSLYAIGNNNWTPCWDFTSNVWRATTNGILYVYCNADNTEFRLPAVDITDYSQTQLRFHAACTTANAQFRVGILDGVTEWLDTITATVTSSVTDAVEYVIPLGSYTGSGKRLVIGGIGSNSVFIQDFFVEPLDGCPPVSSLTVSDITANDATINWVSNGDESEWAVYVDGVLAEITSQTSFALSDLTASTLYSVNVKAICGSDDTARAVTMTFRTSCGLVNIPWTEDFESWPTGSGNYDPCWSSGTTSSSNAFTYASTASGVTSTVLEFYALSNYAAYAVLPGIDTTVDISSLQLSFDIRRMYNYSPTYSILIGLIDSPTYSAGMDIDTVAIVTTAAYDDFEYQDVLFAGHGNENRYILIYDAGPNYIYFDNMRLDYAPACSRPSTVTVTDLSANSATINIIGSSDDNTYHITLNDEDGVDVTGSTYTFTGLNALTTYTVSVATVCDDGDTSMANTITFRTPCDGNVVVPYSEDFESYSYSSSSYDAPDCWSQIGTGYAHIYNYYSHAGSKDLRFYPSGYGNTIAVLPGFAEEVSNLKVTLWSKPEGTSNSGTFSIGYITNPNDTSTFVATFTVNASDYSSDNYVEQTATFENAPDGAHIALRYVPQVAYTNWYWFVDDVEVTLNDGSEPTQYTVSATTANATMGSATVTPSGSVNAGTSVTFTATATEGYHFVNWTNAAGTQVSTNNPYTVNVSSNMSLTANFAPNSSETEYYTVSVTSADATMGNATVTPSGSVAEGTSVTFTATPANGYEFDAWLDGSVRVSTQNPYTVTVSSNISLTATFKAVGVGIDDAEKVPFDLYPNPASTTVYIVVEGESEVTIIDLSGRAVASTRVNGSADLNISNLPSGAYYVRVNNAETTSVRKLIIR